MSEIIVPGNVKSVGSNAFSNCNNLEYVYINQGVEQIYSQAFYGVNNIKELVIAGSVTSVSSAFRYIASVEKAFITNNLDYLYVGSNYIDSNGLKEVFYIGHDYEYKSRIGDSQKIHYLMDDTLLENSSEDSWNYTYEGEQHYWDFVPETSGVYTVETDAEDVLVEVLDSSYYPVSEASEGSKTVFETSAGSRYYIKVSPKSQSKTGKISIKLSGEYAVKYDANEGSNAPDIQTAPFGEEITISSVIPLRTGYEFLGWTTDSQSKSVQYNPGDKIVLNGNITLYAVWSKNIEKPGIVSKKLVQIMGDVHIEPETVLIEAIYNTEGRLESAAIHPMQDKDDVIEVSQKGDVVKYMLWNSLNGMKILADCVQE